ncbi:MAG: class I SAM-dependent methyltransferase [Methylophilaceae bacterium]|nr:class I SAM-dependent methyltransferase [Methylophilaceae bacterium]
MKIKSAWIRQIESGQQPSSSALRDHLGAVHDNNAGFTEDFAWKCRDANGKNSYELLADIIDQKYHSQVLDLGCGSGVLLDLCNQRFGNELVLSGVDMNGSELQLARKRLAHTDTKLYQGAAQNLDFFSDSSFDLIFCHWALTLMDPVTEVLATTNRLLKEKGIFAAIIDGDPKTADGYREVHDIIYEHVQCKYPDYGVFELGDPRVRTAAGLKKLVAETFEDFDINITPITVSYNGAPSLLAREAAGFFYASFVLSPNDFSQMLANLEKYFFTNLHDGTSCFTMPINLLIVRGKGSNN